MLGKKVDGVILPVSIVEPEFLAKVDELKFPCVILGRSDETDFEISWVDMNNTQAGVLATRDSIQRGYRRIAFVSESGSTTFDADRVSGYCRELDAEGLPIDSEMIIHTGAGIENAIGVVRNLLTSEYRPDAVLCSSDIIALGAVRAA